MQCNAITPLLLLFCRICDSKASLYGTVLVFPSFCLSCHDRGPFPSSHSRTMRFLWHCSTQHTTHNYLLILRQAYNLSIKLLPSGESVSTYITTCFTNPSPIPFHYIPLLSALPQHRTHPLHLQMSRLCPPPPSRQSGTTTQKLHHGHSSLARFARIPPAHTIRK